MTKPENLLGESYAPDCPGREILNHVVSRWGTLALLALHERTYRFSELRRRIGGVSEKMLAQTLRLLEEDGFVLRRDFAEVPPRVEYELTPMGRELAKHIATLGRWISDNTATVLAARNKHLRATRRGATVRPSSSAGTSSVRSRRA